VAWSIGFGGFYALICFSADYSPSWVIATTWQFTIIASLFVLMLFVTLLAINWLGKTNTNIAIFPKSTHRF
jgi:hypothetical protein